MAACGGGDRSGAAATDTTASPGAGAPAAAPAAAPGAAPAAPGTGKTVEVRMLGDEKGFRFEPTEITVKSGDTIRWINVSGGPHNVTFWPDSIPAQEPLAANMPNTTAPLTGPLLTDPNAAYTVSFAGVKPGEYKYYCTPHLALGMIARVTVE